MFGDDITDEEEGGGVEGVEEGRRFTFDNTVGAALVLGDGDDASSNTRGNRFDCARAATPTAGDSLFKSEMRSRTDDVDGDGGGGGVAVEGCFDTAPLLI
jgi:hypothetical protein